MIICQIIPNFCDMNWIYVIQFCVAVTLSAFVREMFYTNFGRDTDYREWGISWISSVHVGKFQHSISIRPQPLFSSYFTIQHLSIILSS
jgi:hypothetical protein